MPHGSAIPGSRIGSGPQRPTGRSRPAPRRPVSYWCASGHHTEIQLAAGAAAPPLWDCPHCGQPAGQDRDNPPGPARGEPFKSHLAYVKERRSDADGAALLAEALAALRARRGEPPTAPPTA